MPALPADLATAAADIGLTAEVVLRRTDKTVLISGTFRGHRVAAKFLLDPDPFWAAKLRHEASVYEAFRISPPPLRVPRMLHTDHERVLVLEWLDGRPLDADRYPEQALSAADTGAAVACVLAFNRWQQPTSSFSVIFDYPDRFDRYHARGYLSDSDRQALGRLLDVAGPPVQLNHGDVVPANVLLLGPGLGTLLDWEFTGWFLPGFDLAMLHVLVGAHTPDIRRRLDAEVSAAGWEVPFAVNLAAVLTRELRIHDELPDGPLRHRRLPLIRAAWREAQQRIHRLAEAVTR